MARFLLSAVAALMVGTIAGPAVANPANLTVQASLTSKCRVTAATEAQTLDFGTYTAFDPEKAATAITINFECTRGMAAPTVVFDSGADKTADTAAATVKGLGVVAGLRYEITATRGVTVAGTAASTGSIGSGQTVPVVVTGRIFADQAGTETAGAATQARTLTLNY